jgi:hypothetical protein
MTAARRRHATNAPPASFPRADLSNRSGGGDSSRSIISEYLGALHTGHFWCFTPTRFPHDMQIQPAPLLPASGTTFRSVPQTRQVVGRSSGFISLQLLQIHMPASGASVVMGDRHPDIITRSGRRTISGSTPPLKKAYPEKGGSD